MKVFRTKTPGFSTHSKIKPLEIIEGMGGYPTNIWEDGVQLNLDYDFESHMISFVYMYGEFQDIQLHLNGDFSFKPQGATVQDIQEESNKHRGPWREAESREDWPNISQFPEIFYK